MKKEEKKEVSLLSVNEKLYDDLFVQELEQRLETDPLAANGLIGMFDNGLDSRCLVNWGCEDHTCIEHSKF